MGSSVRFFHPPFLPILLHLLLFHTLAGSVHSSIPGHHQSSSQSSFPSNSSSSSSIFHVQFDPFRPSMEYRCGAFAEQQGPQKDPAMRMLHSIQNSFIEALSQSFPHQKLLSDEALSGQIEAWKHSLIQHREQWFQFDRWWLLLALGLALIPALFVVFYLFARCCICLCRRGKKKAANTAGGAGRTTDRHWDWLRRLLLNAFIGVLVLANVFCAAVLLLSTQYAQHGLDELPTRLHYCANDLLVYRSETAEQIRKLLRDDFARFNQSLQTAFDGTGQAIVQKLKEDTGVDQLERAILRASMAGKMRSTFAEMHQELGRVLDARHSLQIRLLRIRQAREGLADCERTTKSGDRAALCHQARQTLVPVLELASSNGGGGGGEMAGTGDEDWQGDEKPRELDALLPEQVPPALEQIERLDIERRFAAPLEGLHLLQHGIQSVVDGRREDANERIRLLDRTLQSHYEQIASAIKSVDLRFLDEQLLDPMMRQREQFRHIVQYCWLAALVISGLFAFVALCFLLGLCFGCCGRRPSEYADDDCCVRSTGANFFACSIWLSLPLLSLFGLLSGLAMLVGANTAHLVCHPLKEPLARPDMLSLADRLVTLYGLDRPSSSPSAAPINQIFTAKRRPADVVRGCARGQTLYTMLELDKKFALLAERGPADEYEEMANSIRKSLLSGRLLDEAIGQSVGPSVQQQISSGGGNNANSFGARWMAFSTEMRQALEALGRVEMPEWAESPVKEFCAQRIRFQQLETIIAELRRLKQSFEEKQAAKGGDTSGGPASGSGGVDDQAAMTTTVEELDSVLRFLEELRPETVQVRALIESGCARLEQLRSDVLTLRFNATSLLADLDRTQAEFGSEQRIRQKLHAVATELALDLAGMVRQYEQHVNESMRSEVSSCAPLAEIARHTRASLCDYALDPLNSLWLALGVGLALLLPIILLATMLNPLYRRTSSYPKYTVPSSSSTDCPNEARFATDIYGLTPATYYGTGATTLKASSSNNNGHHHHQQQHPPSFCTQITSPYATSNYCYQELGPPVYMGTSRR